MQSWHDGAYTASLAGVPVIRLGVETGIRQDRVQFHALQSGLQERDEAVHIDLRTAARNGTYDEVTGTVDGRF